MVDLKPKTINCLDCGKEFVFTVGEQNFYLQKAFSEPRRCQDCRKRRKKEDKKKKRALLKSLGYSDNKPKK